MKITRTISSTNPSKCYMVAKGFFGNVKGEVKHHHNGVRDWYAIIVDGKWTGEATDFTHACDSLLMDLKVITTTYA